MSPTRHIKKDIMIGVIIATIRRGVVHKNMSRVLLAMAVAAVSCISAWADTVPVAGSTTGVFSNISVGSLSNGDTEWDFGNGNSKVTFTGVTFGVPTTLFTPIYVNLGTISLSAGPAAGVDSGTDTATLSTTVSFTTPNVPNAGTFSDALNLVVNKLAVNNVTDALSVNISTSSLAPFSFQVGSEIYTVTYLGLFSDSGYGVQNSFQTAVSDKWAYLSGYGLLLKFSWSDWFNSQLSVAHPDGSKSNLDGVGDKAKNYQTFLSFTWVLQ